MNKEMILKSFKEETLEHYSNYEKMSFQERIHRFMREKNILRLPQDFLSELSSWYQNIFHLFIFDELRERSIEELIFHGDHVQLKGENQGPLKLEKINSLEREQLIQCLVHKNKVDLSYQNPFRSFDITLFEDKYRVSVTHRCLSPSGSSKLFLRKHLCAPPKITAYSQKLKEILELMISRKDNIIVCGPTGSGKTTLIRSFIQEVPENEHLLILEDTHEIFLARSRVTHLLASEKSSERSLSKLCSYSLRMSPERIILGEIRGDEIIPFSLIMNTGHKGAITSLHASSAPDALKRMAILFSTFQGTVSGHWKEALDLIAPNVDKIIYMEEKEIRQIIRIRGASEGNIFFESLYERPTSKC